MALPEAHKQAIAPCPMRDTQRPFRVLTGCLLLLTCGVLLLRQAGNNSGQGTETTSIRIKQAAVSTKKSQMAQQQEEITIVAFSDSHGLHLRPSKLAVPTEGQVLLIAGDLGLEGGCDVEVGLMGPFEAQMAVSRAAEKLGVRQSMRIHVVGAAKLLRPGSWASTTSHARDSQNQC